MIRKMKDSLTIKICILIAVLLVAASGITYGVIARFLPAYYSNQLEKNLDAVSQEMAGTISSFGRIEDAFSTIELFEKGSQVVVVILDEQGNAVWPVVELVEEIALMDDNPGFGDAIAEAGQEQVYDYEEKADEKAEGIGAGEGTAEAEEAADAEEAAEAEVTAGDAIAVSEEDETWERLVKVYFGDAVESAKGNGAVKHYDLAVGNNKYTMMVSGGMQPVNQAMEILYRIFPYILVSAVGVALLFAIVASLYLTAPMIRLSRISKAMAALDFGDRYQGRRTDEIGILGRNLNELSENLSRALDELQQANEKLKSDIEREREMEKKRIEFFSAVSHELKTPITILKGHLSGMLQGVGEYRDRERYLKRSRETVEKMESMVEELLTVSRIENNAFITQKTDIAEQLRQQAADMTELMEEKNLELAADLPDHLYAQVNPSMMEKVFRNLLINAVRYTPAEAGNQIRIILTEAASPQAGFVCCIENTGVSIPEEALPHLFEAFYRVEQSRNRQTGGSGLGLYIVKMVLEQHGARYCMENSREGVRFCFSLSF